VLVAAVRRDQRDEALRELLGQLGLAGFGALVIAAVVGERLAKAALRPVERYRAQADSIAAGQLGLRLDVPADRDDEVTRLGHTFNDVLGALERAVEHERRFVQDASHELRTPLTLLSARIQLLRRRTRTLDEHERALDELETDIGALRALADQLLDIGTATDAPTQPAPTATDISATLHRMRLTGTDTTLHTDPGATLTDMPADQVRQIVANLITNARTHGQPPYTITVRTIPGAVVITVNDAGPGMPAAFLPVAADVPPGRRHPPPARSRARPRPHRRPRQPPRWRATPLRPRPPPPHLRNPHLPLRPPRDRHHRHRRPALQPLSWFKAVHPPVHRGDLR